MLEAIFDVGQAAVVLSSAVLALANSLFQVWVAGLVLGVHGQIVKPLAAINGGHGQGNQEGIAGRSHIFGNAGFYHQIKPLIHVGGRGMTGSIGFGHGNATVLHGSFQSVLHIRRIACESCGQLIVQSIAGEVVDTALRLVSLGSGHADSGQHGVGAIRGVEAVQHANLTLIVHQLIVHGDVGHLQIGELHALNGVLAQLVNNGVVMQTGRDVGFCVPYTIRAGLGDIVLINRKRRFLAGVNGRFCGKCRSQSEGHEHRHQQRQYATNLFHLVFSYYNKFWLEAQHPAGLLSFSCLSYNEGEQPADHYLLGLLCP